MIFRSSVGLPKGNEFTATIQVGPGRLHPFLRRRLAAVQRAGGAQRRHGAGAGAGHGGGGEDLRGGSAEVGHGSHGSHGGHGGHGGHGLGMEVVDGGGFG